MYILIHGISKGLFYFFILKPLVNAERSPKLFLWIIKTFSFTYYLLKHLIQFCINVELALTKNINIWATMPTTSGGGADGGYSP